MSSRELQGGERAHPMGERLRGGTLVEVQENKQSRPSCSHTIPEWQRRVLTLCSEGCEGTRKPQAFFPSHQTHKPPNGPCLSAEYLRATHPNYETKTPIPHSPRHPGSKGLPVSVDYTVACFFLLFLIIKYFNFKLNQKTKTSFREFPHILPHPTPHPALISYITASSMIRP